MTETEEFLLKIWSYTSTDARCFAIAYGEEFRHKYYCIKALFSKTELGEVKKSDVDITFVELRDDIVPKVIEDVKELIDKGVPIYYGVLPLLRPPREAENVKVALYLFADFDYESVEQRPPKEEFLKKLEAIGLLPIILVDSGRGYQGLWKLKYEVDTRTFIKLEGGLINKFKESGLPVDEKVKDPPRLLRLPGSINQRNGRRATVIHSDDGIEYDPEELMKKLGVEEIVDKKKRISEDGLILLKDSELSEIKDRIKPAYRKGCRCRQDLILYFSGWFAKARIHPICVVKLAKWLHDETDDEDPLEMRIGAIVYTYKKAGIDIDKYVNEIKEIADIEKVYGYAKEIEKRQIKGYSGVQEILEKELGEEKAEEVMKEIQRILKVASPYRGDPVYLLLNEEKQLYAINDPRIKQIYRKRYINDPKNPRGDIVVEGAFVDVTVYETKIKDVDRMFEVTVESYVLSEPLPLEPRTIDEIIAELKRKGLIINKRLAEDTITAVLNGFVKAKKAKIEKGPPYPGFFWIDGKLVANRIEIKEVTKEELKEALLLLNELAEKWYIRSIDKFATVIKWGIISPFIFARKQIDNKSLQVPDLILQGPRNTGKTTLGEIAAAYLWGRERTKVTLPVGEIITEPRFGGAVSKDTFPRVANEVNSIFENEKIVNAEKVKVDDLVLRGRYEGLNVYRTFFSLSGLIFTLNPRPRVDFEKLEIIPKTAWLLEFTTKEIFSEDEKNKFNMEVLPRLYKLSAIGYWVAKHMLENQELIKTPNWLDLAEELLERAYKSAGLEVPAWIKLRYKVKTYQDILEEKKLRVIAMLKEAINEKAREYLGKIIVELQPGNWHPSDKLRDIIDALTQNDKIPWIIRKGDTLYITTLVTEELEDLQITNLKDLAELLELEDRYHQKYSIRVSINGKSKVINGDFIELTIDEFASLLKLEVVDNEENKG